MQAGSSGFEVRLGVHELVHHGLQRSSITRCALMLECTVQWELAGAQEVEGNVHRRRQQGGMICRGDIYSELLALSSPFRVA